jgi:hypothetical protein
MSSSIPYHGVGHEYHRLSTCQCPARSNHPEEKPWFRSIIWNKDPLPETYKAYKKTTRPLKQKYQGTRQVFKKQKNDKSSYGRTDDGVRAIYAEGMDTALETTILGGRTCRTAL